MQESGKLTPNDDNIVGADSATKSTSTENDSIENLPISKRRRLEKDSPVNSIVIELASEKNPVEAHFSTQAILSKIGFLHEISDEQILEEYKKYAPSSDYLTVLKGITGILHQDFNGLTIASYFFGENSILSKDENGLKLSSVSVNMLPLSNHLKSSIENLAEIYAEAVLEKMDVSSFNEQENDKNQEALIQSTVFCLNHFYDFLIIFLNVD